MGKAVKMGNALRQEARKIFRIKLLEALDVALAKYDTVTSLLTPRYLTRHQMEASYSTRFRKTSPACVACDRPLNMMEPRVKELQLKGKLGHKCAEKEQPLKSNSPASPDVSGPPEVVAHGEFEVLQRSVVILRRKWSSWAILAG